MVKAWPRSKRTQTAPFPFPSPLTRLNLKRVLALATMSFQRQWHPGTGGNFSVRDSANLAWVSASGRHKGELTIRDFLPVDVMSAQPVPPSYRQASDETALHCAVYRCDPSARAVLHVHPPYSVALLQQPYRLQQNEMLKVFGLQTHDTEIMIPVRDNSQDMQGFAQEIEAELDLQLKVLVLAGHGVYAWGRDPDEAMYRIEALEYLCQLQTFGRPTSFPLS